MEKINLNLSTRPKISILDKPLSRGKGEVSLSCYALLFSEVVQYSQSRVNTIPDLQNKYLCRFLIVSTILLLYLNSRLHDLGKDVGCRIIDLYFVRERNSKRETKLINMLLFIKTTLWKVSYSTCLLCEMYNTTLHNYRHCLERMLTNWNMQPMTNAHTTSSRRSRWSTNLSACRKIRVP